MKFLSAIFIFLTVILIHELGHFLAAKFVGIKVNEFSIGMGPLIYKTQSKETQYSIRLLPIGGFVAMEGEDEDSSDPRSFSNANVKDKILVIIAGALMNFLLAIFIFTIVSYNVGSPTNIIGEFTENSAAEIAGIEIGDEITYINDQKINSWTDITQNIQNADRDKNLKIETIKNGEKREYEIKPKLVDGRAVIGIMPQMEKSLKLSITGGFKQTFTLVALLFSVFKALFTGKLGLEMLSGPVGVITEIGVATQYGVIAVLNFLAFMSVNLGFFNLLPIPALDGGRLFFLIIEYIRGKPISEEIEGRIHFIGFILLITLMIVVTFKDLFSLFLP